MWNDDNIEQEVIRIIAEQIGISKEELKRTDDIYDLGADSLDMVEIIMTFEDVFDIEISENETDKNKLCMVGSAIDFVKEKILVNNKFNFI